MEDGLLVLVSMIMVPPAPPPPAPSGAAPKLPGWPLEPFEIIVPFPINELHFTKMIPPPEPPLTPVNALFASPPPPPPPINNLFTDPVIEFPGLPPFKIVEPTPFAPHPPAPPQPPPPPPEL